MHCPRRFLPQYRLRGCRKLSLKSRCRPRGRHLKTSAQRLRRGARPRPTGARLRRVPQPQLQGCLKITSRWDWTAQKRRRRCPSAAAAARSPAPSAPTGRHCPRRPSTPPSSCRVMLSAVSALTCRTRLCTSAGNALSTVPRSRTRRGSLPVIWADHQALGCVGRRVEDNPLVVGDPVPAGVSMANSGVRSTMRIPIVPGHTRLTVTVSTAGSLYHAGGRHGIEIDPGQRGARRHVGQSPHVVGVGDRSTAHPGWCAHPTRSENSSSQVSPPSTVPARRRPPPATAIGGGGRGAGAGRCARWRR